MQIELSFRDLKSHRYGQGVEEPDALRQAHRDPVAGECPGSLCQLAGWLARRPVSLNGYRHFAPLESSTPSCASVEKHSSETRRWNKRLSGWHGCDHCPIRRSIRCRRRREFVGKPRTWPRSGWREELSVLNLFNDCRLSFVRCYHAKICLGHLRPRGIM